MKIIISERQLKVISENGISADWGGLKGLQYHKDNLGPALYPDGLTLPDQESYDIIVKRLFDEAKTWQSTAQDWKNLSNLALQMKTAMSGIGSGNILNLLSQINTKPKLAAIVKNWKYDGYDLYQWLSDEYGLSWYDVAKVFTKNFPNDVSLKKGAML